MKKWLCVSVALTMISQAYCQLNILDSLKKELIKHRNDSTAVVLNLKIAEILFPQNKSAEALPFVQQALTISDKLGYTKGKAWGLFNRGVYNYYTNEFAKGIQDFEASISLLVDSNEKILLSRCYSWLANSYYVQSNFYQSLQNHLKALAIRESIKDNVGVAQSLNNISTVYIEQKDFETALSFQLRSLKIKQELKDTRGIAFSLNNLGFIYSNLNKLALAESNFNNAYKLFDSLQFKRGIASALGNLGEILEKKEQYPEAIKTLKKAIAIIEALDDKKAFAEAYNHLASCELFLMHFMASQQYLELARSYALAINSETDLIDNYLYAAKLDSATGNLTSYIEWYKKYVSLKDKTFNLEKSNQLTQMRAFYDAAKKDNEIALLKKEQEAERQVKKAQTTTYYFVIAGLFVLAVILVLVVQQKQRNNVRILKQRKKLDELNQLKDRLFSIIAHDLRSPLNSLRLIMELFSKQALSENELKEMVAQLNTSTKNTSNLIENLLYWAKANISGTQIQYSRFSLKELVDESLQVLQSTAALKKIKLQSHLNNQFLVNADRDMINLVVRNLITNAIKYTREGGIVDVDAIVNLDKVLLKVKDNGVGMMPDRLSKLFGNDNVSTRGTNNEAGTGLGLILCKDFLEKNGGEMTVESELEKGSTFSFTLPLAA